MASPKAVRTSTLIVAPAAFGAVVAGFLAVVCLTASVSPLSLGRADAQLALGAHDEAAALYVELGTHSPNLRIRKRSLERAAKLHSMELDQMDEARRLLKLRLALGGRPEELSALREELAELHLSNRDLEAAARQYTAAHTAMPGKSGLLVRAAELWESAGNPERAKALWTRLMNEHPEQGFRANLGLASLALASGRPAAALSPFQAAARADDEAIASAARLGLAACYERLGELDGALAELDLTGAPSDVLEHRKAALRERANVRGTIVR